MTLLKGRSLRDKSNHVCRCLHWCLFSRVTSYLLKHVREMFSNDSKGLSIHSKMVQFSSFGLIYMTHILQADVHLLYRKWRLDNT